MITQLRTDRDGATLIFTLEGHDGANALTPAVCAAGIEACNMAEGNADIRSLVITGAGSGFAQGAPDSSDAAARWVDTLHALPKPVVAAVHGAAGGTACTLALACDFVIATHDARFVLPAPRQAGPAHAHAHAHAHTLPRQQLLEWLWLAPVLGAARLHALGLVNRLAGEGQALAEALALCRQLNDLPPAVVAAGKALVNRAPMQSLAAHLNQEREPLHAPAARRGPA